MRLQPRGRAAASRSLPRRSCSRSSVRRVGCPSLSPTDAITEAVRCACELDVPLYGWTSRMLRPPARPGLAGRPGTRVHRPPGDVSRNTARAAPRPGPGRRLAARGRHGGAAQGRPSVPRTGPLRRRPRQWGPLMALLGDDTLAPATTDLRVARPEAIRALRRVVLHPSLAGPVARGVGRSWRCSMSGPACTRALGHPDIGGGETSHTVSSRTCWAGQWPVRQPNEQARTSGLAGT